MSLCPRASVLVLPITLGLALTVSPTATGQPSNCVEGTISDFEATPETIQTYNVPLDASVLFVAATGAGGGESVEPLGRGMTEYFGGAGASLFVELPVLGGETLDVIVGRRGEDGDLDGAGGGGGSFVWMQGSLSLWVAAGGGGGAGSSQNGKAASLGLDGVDADGPCGGAGGTDGNGGFAADTDFCTGPRGGDDAAGGGGWLSAGENGTATGGDRVSPPGTAAGGTGTDTNDGGYGGGGGGSNVGGGGGGGASGGGGGGSDDEIGMGADGGAGGGSFVADHGVLLDTALDNSGDGGVFICVLPEFSGGGRVLEVPVGGPWARAGFAVLLALVALLGLRRLG